MSAIMKQLIMIIFQEIMSKLLEEMEQITLELHQTDGKEIQIMHHHLTINQLGLMLTELLSIQNTWTLKYPSQIQFQLMEVVITKSITLQIYLDKSGEFLSKMELLMPELLQIDGRAILNTSHLTIINQPGLMLIELLSIQSISMLKFQNQTQCQSMEAVIMKHITLQIFQDSLGEFLIKTVLQT